MKKLILAISLLLVNFCIAQKELEAIHVCQGTWNQDHFEYNSGKAMRIDIVFTSTTMSAEEHVYTFTSSFQHTFKKGEYTRTFCTATDEKGKSCVITWCDEENVLPTLLVTYEKSKRIRYQLMNDAYFPLND